MFNEEADRISPMVFKFHCPGKVPNRTFQFFALSRKHELQHADQSEQRKTREGNC
jgi:hypothetical protein